MALCLDDIRKVRETGFKDELDSIKRQENVIYYRKDVNIWPEAIQANKRLKKVNDIFRYNLANISSRPPMPMTSTPISTPKRRSSKRSTAPVSIISILCLRKPM